MALSLTELRGFITTDLEDEPLQLLLDAAYETLDDYLGIEGTGYEGNLNSELISAGSGDLLRLSRRALAITSVTEGTTVLEDDDYELRPSGTILVRKYDGTNPSRRWRGRIDVRYSTVLDGAERDRVAVALVQLELDYRPGAASETIGAWSEQRSSSAEGATYPELKAEILASYGSPDLIMV